jgi:hypothetical protein
MRDIESLIREYCTQNLPPEPIWISILNRWYPRLAARLDSAKTVQREIEDHLRDSYEANIVNAQNPDKAWKLARDHFGDIALLSQEILKARTQSYKCLATRFLAVVALVFLPLGKNARFEPVQFFHPPTLGLMAACAAVGYMITRRGDWGFLRRNALYGAWIGLLWGISRGLTVDVPAELGAPIAMVLLSTFYGLFFAAPTSRGAMPALMMVLCQFGVLISLTRVGILSLHPGFVDAEFLKMVVVFSIVPVLAGLIVFDVRKLHLRLAGIAVFSMVYAYIQILSNLTRPYATIFDLVCATTIPPLLAVLIIFPIHRLQEHLLKKAYPTPD